MCVCTSCQYEKKFRMWILSSANLNRYMCNCIFASFSVRACVHTYVHVHTSSTRDPQGQKSKRMRVYNNNTAGSPEQCVNMDTMEMHYAIMADFMHFSLAGRMGREWYIKEREREKFGKGQKTEKPGEGQLREERENKCGKVRNGGGISGNTYLWGQE